MKHTNIKYKQNILQNMKYYHLFVPKRHIYDLFMCLCSVNSVPYVISMKINILQRMNANTQNFVAFPILILTIVGFK